MEDIKIAVMATVENDYIVIFKKAKVLTSMRTLFDFVRSFFKSLENRELLAYYIGKFLFYCLIFCVIFYIFLDDLEDKILITDQNLSETLTQVNKIFVAPEMPLI